MRNTVQTCSVMLRGDLARSFLNSPLAQGGYAVDDWPLFLHVTQHAPLGRLPESLATYRRVPGSVTNSGAASNERRIMDQFRLIDDASTLIDDDEAADAARAGGLRTTAEALISSAWVIGDRDRLARAIVAGDAWGVPLTTQQRRLARVLAVPCVPGLTRSFYRLRQRAGERVRYG